MSRLTNNGIIKDMRDTQGKVSSLDSKAIEQKIDLWSRSLELNEILGDKPDTSKIIENLRIERIITYDYIQKLEKANNILFFISLTVSIFCLIK